MSVLIQASGVRYLHGGNEVFSGVDFEIQQGDRIALVGENGAGKSTLFRLLAGQLTPDQGEVVHRRNTVVGYLEQEPAAPPGRSILETVTEGSNELDAVERRMRELELAMQEADPDAFDAVLEEYAACQERFDALGGHDLASRAEAVLTGLGFPEERWSEPFNRLSGGEKKLVGLARLLVREGDPSAAAGPSVLLLDEPDNHLDFAGKAWLRDYMAGHRGAVAIISHDRYFLDQAVNKIFELEDGKIYVYHCAYTAALQEKRERLERDAELYALRQREFKQLKESAERLTEWARQNPKFAKRAGNRRRLLEIEREKLESKPAPVLDRKRIDVDFQADRGSRIALNIEGVSKTFGQGEDEREVLKPFDLLIQHGERVGLVGVNGSGKTTLFRMILGEAEPTTGTIRTGPSCRIGYYSQEQETLDPDRTPLEIVRSLRSYSEPQALGFLNSLLFDRENSLTRVRNLSGGERSRLQIAVLMLRDANFLILDEPTNNLDIPSCEELESALLDFDGTILTISHDRYFLDKICTRIVELDGGIVREYPGGFTYFDQHRGAGRVLTVA